MEALLYIKGDRVLKTGGSFEATGTIVAAFNNTSGDARYVMEFDVPPGMLHIYTANQLRVLPPQAVTEPCPHCGRKFTTVPLDQIGVPE